MAFRGMTFDTTPVISRDDGAMYQNHLKNGIYKDVLNELFTTSSGLDITVQSGYVSVLGRQIVNDINELVTIDGGIAEGFVIVKIDLNQLPGEQVSLTFKQAATLGAVVLIQDDLNNGGLIYEYPIWDYVSNGVTITLNDSRAYTKRPNVLKINFELEVGNWVLIVGGLYDTFFKYDIADSDILKADVVILGPAEASDVDGTYDAAGIFKVNDSTDGNIEIRAAAIPAGSVFVNYHVDRGVE